MTSPLPIASREPQLKFAWFRLAALPTLAFIPHRAQADPRRALDRHTLPLDLRANGVTVPGIKILTQQSMIV